jgi:hypothetical protein
MAARDITDGVKRVKEMTTTEGDQQMLVVVAIDIAMIHIIGETMVTTEDGEMIVNTTAGGIVREAMVDQTGTIHRGIEESQPPTLNKNENENTVEKTVVSM